MRYRMLALAVVFTISISPAVANWGHWRGDTGNGASATATPPTTWSDSENVKWKVAIPGRGSGSPVVWGDSVFVVTAVPADGSTQAEPAPVELRFALVVIAAT